MNEPNEILDLRGVPCPSNSAKALIRIATMSTGEVLELILDSGEPMENVPTSLVLEGHVVLSKRSLGEHWSLIVEVCS